jgi:hypothetical protein
MAVRIQLRRDTAANWSSENPTLAAGEVGVDLTSGQVKVGDGATAWDDLEYLAGEGGEMSAAAILAALVTVDGAGSGLDADLLDGQHAAAFEAAGAAAAAVSAHDADTTVHGVNTANLIATTTASLAGASFFVDDDTMAGNSAQVVASQQSIVAYVAAQIAALIGGAPGALDTLNELAAALGDDADFAATITAALADKAAIADAVMKSLFDANTILAANTDNTPTARAIGEGELVGRATGGNIGPLAPAQVRTLLGPPSGLTPDPPEVVSDPTDTLSAADHGHTIRYTNAGLVTVTIPTDGSEDLVDGFWCALYAEGAAGVTLSTAGITLTGSSPNTTISQNEVMVVMKTATANTWMVLGATAA